MKTRFRYELKIHEHGIFSACLTSCPLGGNARAGSGYCVTCKHLVSLNRNTDMIECDSRKSSSKSNVIIRKRGPEGAVAADKERQEQVKSSWLMGPHHISFESVKELRVSSIMASGLSKNGIRKKLVFECDVTGKKLFIVSYTDNSEKISTVNLKTAVEEYNRR